MKLKEIHRTATFAWSPFSEPLLVSGTVAGALDESFSNDSQLEIWAPDFKDKSEYDLGQLDQNKPKASITTSSKFNRLAWGVANNIRGKGIIAAGMESGELGLWDPEKILSTSDSTSSLIQKNTTHQGSVRGLEFNPIQTNLLSSGAINGEIYIWDLKDPSKPYTPGTRSSKLDEISSLAWNRQVPHILASSSSSGYTVVWDLRNKREVVALAYGGATQGLNIMGAGGRKGMSDVAWHPDNATRLVTSSEDDASPIVMAWDLRNARAPEKILTGHEKGVLSLSWCKQDAELLLSCGKDSRVLCWNPQSGEVIGEIPSSDNWAFEVQWCPKNPDIFSVAYFDGTIGVHSIQSTNESADAQVAPPTPQPDGSDVFDVPGYSRTTQSTLSLKQPPKWLKRPVSSSFGYGGKLVSVSNLPSAQGKTQSSVVHLRKVITEPSIVDRAKELKVATDRNELDVFAKDRSKGADAKESHDAASWKALSSLFKADSRDELLTLLGFSKAEIASRVAEAVEKIKANVTPTQLPSDEFDASDRKPHEPVVSFAEPELSVSTPDQENEPTPSEQSTSVTSDRTESTKAADGESTTTTAPSLFGDDVIGTPQLDAEADFFSTMGTIREDLNDRIQVPHQNYGVDSSVAATIGSRPSSAASEMTKSNTFRIYPSEESEIDRLVTKSLVLGDFESAVSLCLSAERFADAILVAVKGGPDLLQRTQKTYFEKRTVNLPYLRLFQSIVTEDLDDIVQNADLQEWQEIFVVLCTFAKPDEFANLAEQLGQRLEFQASLVKGSEGAATAEELRKNATLTYLAAGRLEKVVNIWIEEMSEEESRFLNGSDGQGSSRYSAHAHALQTFMEKVAVFRSATKYADTDINVSPDPNVIRSYKLSGLYERYFEYADLLATQGLLDEAVSFLKLIPSDYQSNAKVGIDFSMARDRLTSAADVSAVRRSVPGASTSAILSPTSIGCPVTQPRQVPTATAPRLYTPYNANGSALTNQPPNTYTPLTNSTVPASIQTYQPTAPMQSYGSTGFGTATAYNPPAPAVPAPPPHSSNTVGSNAGIPPPPPPKKQDNSGWNDAPIAADRRTPAPHAPPKVAPITAPFPNASPAPPSAPGSPALHGPHQGLPPPPRPGSVNRGHPKAPPPGPGQQRPAPGSQHGQPQGPYAPPPGRSFSPFQQGQAHQPGQQAPPPPRGHAPPQYAPPAGRALSPPQPPQGLPRQPPPPGPGQFGGQPMRGPGMPPAPGAGGPVSFARATPPPGWAGPGGPGGAHPAPTGLSPPPHVQGHPGHYGPPPSSSRQMSHGGPGVQPPHQQAPPPQRGPPPSASAPPQGPPGPSNAAPRAPPPAKQGPPPPKYPPGDRSHIPDSSKRAFSILLQALEHMKQISPPQDKRMVDDTERRLNALFDSLNCETLSPPVIDQLNSLTDAMAAHDQPRSLAIHADLLAQGSRTDDIGLWMSAIKQLILRL